MNRFSQPAPRLGLVLCFAAAVLMPAGAFAQQPAPQPVLPASVALDVRESYHLLASTFYRKVDPQQLLDAARAALGSEAHKNGAKVAIPSLTVQSDSDTTAGQLDQAIETVAFEAHGAPTEYAYAAIAGMAKAVNDRWTQFFDPEQFKMFNDELDPEKISGIGVEIEQDPTTQLVRVWYVVPGTPADRAGLGPGDEFVSIDGTSAKGITQEYAGKLLRGKPGTAVHLIVASDGAANRDLTIVRSEVQPPTVIYKLLSDNIGYVHVLAFGRSTPSEFDLALAHLKSASAIVLDLRNDGGGFVDSALEISSRFIARKPLVTVHQRDTGDQTIDADDEARINVPVTVLVNENTASASEITAGALQDDGVALLVGAKTYGKGVMQTLTPLADGSAIKITTASYLTPNGQDINLRGIEPDLLIDENHDARFGEVARDAQLRAALGLLQKKIAEVSKP